MSALIKDISGWVWDGKVYDLKQYSGICHICGESVDHFESFCALKLREDDSSIIFSPLAVLRCPSCKNIMSLMRMYKNLEISQELKTISKSVKND
jgi:hypothetical protein